MGNISINLINIIMKDLINLINIILIIIYNNNNSIKNEKNSNNNVYINIGSVITNNIPDWYLLLYYLSIKCIPIINISVIIVVISLLCIIYNTTSKQSINNVNNIIINKK